MKHHRLQPLIARLVDDVLDLVAKTTLDEIAHLRRSTASQPREPRIRRRGAPRSQQAAAPATPELEPDVAAPVHEITDPNALLARLEAIARGDDWVDAAKPTEPTAQQSVGSTHFVSSG